MTSSNLNGANDTSATNALNRNLSATVDSAEQRTPKPSKFIKASNAWRCFESSLEEIAKYSSVFSLVEQAMDRCSEMELETQSVKNQNADLKLAQQVNMQEYGRLTNEIKEEKAKMEKRLEDEKANMSSQADSLLEKQNATHLRDVAELEKKISSERTKSAMLSKDLEKAKIRAQKFESDLSHCTEQLKEWQGYESSLQDKDFDKFTDRVNHFYKTCHGICRKYFFRDLHEKYFADPIQWEKLFDLHEFPLKCPPLNSPAAKAVRMAIAMHVIACQLRGKFFKPCYIPKPPCASKDISAGNEIEEVLEEILADQFATDTKKERLTRALLLSTYPPEVTKDHIKRAVQKATGEVSEKLFSVGADEKFHREVEDLFYKAAELWKYAQVSTQMVEASLTDEDFLSWPWAQLEEFNSDANKEKETSWEAAETVTLFPRIYAPESDTISHPGISLLSSHPIVAAAEQEFKRWKLNRKSNAGRDTNGRHGGPRRPSLRVNRTNILGGDDKVAFLDPQAATAGAVALGKGGLAQNVNRAG